MQQPTSPVEVKPRSPVSNDLSVQIEVDIDPPPHKPDDPSDDVLEALGLPTHHVHFSSKDGSLKEIATGPDKAKGHAKGLGEKEEILRPNDITVFTYQVRWWKISFRKLLRSNFCPSLAINGVI